MALPMAERIERIKTEILPNLRAIPESNIALACTSTINSHQDQKVTERRYCLTIELHLFAFIHRVPKLSARFTRSPFQDMMTKHHQGL